MYIWNEYLIEKNLNNIKKLLIKSKKQEDVAILNNVLYTYYKIEDIAKDITEERYLREYSKFANVANIEDDDICERNMLHTIYEVSYFLKDFNEEYFEYFDKMLKSGLIFLDKSESKVKSNHYLDPINKMGFIHIRSDFNNIESSSLIEEFGRVLQSSKNEKSFDESKIAFKDAFPLYLKYSMMNYYGINSKEDIVETIKLENEEIFAKMNKLDSKLEKEYSSREMVSNYFTMFMFLNNDIDATFDSVNEFMHKNHNNTKIRNLWTIANKNVEGIDHIKEQSLSKKK